MQKLINTSQNLLDEKGQLSNPGYATKLLWKYSRDMVKSPKILLKEWDYYLIYNQDYAIALTVADNGYLGVTSASVLEWDSKFQVTKSKTMPLTMGKLGMPSSSDSGDIKVKNKQVKMNFIVDDRRKLEVCFDDYHERCALKGHVYLHNHLDMDSMVIATPFHNSKRAFYYNQKITCMPAHGEITLGDKTYAFDPEDSFGILDWGRGVWTYKNTWYWGSASGRLGEDVFGFNIGYGFGDTSHATENMLFFNDKAHKLEHINFHIPEDYLKPWKFSSSDGRFEMDFMPILDRSDHINALVIETNQHQVFGRYTGTAILDDGTKVELNDFLGFAEKVSNRW